jgi:hypothetical protein
MVINVTWIPFIAVGVAVVALAVRHLTAPAVVYTGYNRGNPLLVLCMSVVAMAIFAGLSITASSDWRNFRADPYCAAGFAADSSHHSELCSLAVVTIVDHDIVYGRRSTTYYLDLDLGHGEQQRVALYRFSQAFWNGARSGADKTAVAQLYRGTVVALETPSGVSETSVHPAATTSRYELAGALFGGLGVFFALAMSFRSSGWAF